MFKSPTQEASSTSSGRDSKKRKVFPEGPIDRAILNQAQEKCSESVEDTKVIDEAQAIKFYYDLKAKLERKPRESTQSIRTRGGKKVYKFETSEEREAELQMAARIGREILSSRKRLF